MQKQTAMQMWTKDNSSSMLIVIIDNDFSIIYCWDAFLFLTITSFKIEIILKSKEFFHHIL